MAELDPFSQVHNALWVMVERNLAIEDYIPINNRIKYDSEQSRKDQISSADVPELALIVNGTREGKTTNSCQSSLIRTYTWIITSGEFTINRNYNPLCFEIYRALIDWNSTLCPLTWKTHNFVEYFQVSASTEGNMMEDIERGIRGWCCLWDCDVHFSFCTADLILETS